MENIEPTDADVTMGAARAKATPQKAAKIKERCISVFKFVVRNKRDS